MDIQRIAIIFDTTLRPETSGVYCKRALERHVEVQHFQPHELDRIPTAGFDLYLNIDDGLRYHLPPGCRPSAFWAVDTHVDFDRCREKAPRFDLVFAAQRDGVDLLRGIGVRSASWLPLACDPGVHRKHDDLAKQFDIAFVGNIFPGPRADLLTLIQRRYKNTFAGQAYFDDMARTYSAARIAFNRSIRNDVNMRVFEAVGCGSLLMTNDLSDNGLDELFRDGAHLATYRDGGDLLDKLGFYLEREALRERIAAAGRAEAIAKHTYAHRMETILRRAEETLLKRSVAVGWVERSGIHQEPAKAIDPRSEALPFGAGLPTPPSAGPEVSHTQKSKASPDPFYFGYPRPEVVALVPQTARRVLDIGCGAGRLGEAIKQRQPATVSGIELDAQAATTARGRLDHVWAGDIEELDLDIPPGSFDAIVCADVLEHLREPARVLKRIREWLAPDGCIVASIPNVRHHSIVRSLLQGNWTYESAGLLDRTHLRFFTRREIEKLFHRAGFAIDGMWSVNGPGDDPSQRHGANGAVQLGSLSIAGLSQSDADEFYTYQFLIRAQPLPAPEYGLTSIVIVTYNEITFTRQCLDSIRLLTDEPYEIIVVDNGSTDGSVEYLRAMGDVRLIENDSNRGFPAAANQGMAVAAGKQVLLLNNDLVVTTGWLGRMLRALRGGDSRVGLVGPRSNLVSGPQQVEVAYENIAELDGFAWDFGKCQNGVTVDVSRLVGFCLLIKREVTDAIGLLDEQFGLGCFEDDDYCLRAIAAGFQAVIAGDAFVHHFGSRTFLGSGVDAGSLMRENHARFIAKWSANGNGRNGEHAQPSPMNWVTRSPRVGPGPFAVDIAPEGGLRLRLDLARPKVSLCMIVRDNARTIGPCLESIRPWVDEMIVVDTGSVDETPRIVESFGAKLYHFPWCDDFSAARNESLRHATGDWLFWMDSDDTIPAECGHGLRQLVERQNDPSIVAYVMQVHCLGSLEEEQAGMGLEAVDHVKLFRNLPELRFDGRMHEQILTAINRMNGGIAATKLHVVHSGSDRSPAGQARKLERDMRLLLLELAERPEHPFTLFNLGMTQLHLNRSADAADYLRRSLAVSPPSNSHVKKAFALLALAEMQQGRREEALAACRQGLKFQPHDVELRFREAGALQELGRLAEARDAYMALLDDGASGAFQFSSINLGMRGSCGGVSPVATVPAELRPDFFQPELRPYRRQPADGGEGRV